MDGIGNIGRLVSTAATGARLTGATDATFGSWISLYLIARTLAPPGISFNGGNSCWRGKGRAASASSFFFFGLEMVREVLSTAFAPCLAAVVVDLTKALPFDGLGGKLVFVWVGNRKTSLMGSVMNKKYFLSNDTYFKLYFKKWKPDSSISLSIPFRSLAFGFDFL